MTLTGKTKEEVDLEVLKLKQADTQTKVSKLINDVYWRIERYESQSKLGTATTDSESNYKAILLYIEDLRKINHQKAFDTNPDAISWPVLYV